MREVFGVILKLVGYGLVRILRIRGGRIRAFISLGLVGGFFVFLICLCQFDIKSLVAYSSIAHIGLVISGGLIIIFIYITRISRNLKFVINNKKILFF